MNTRSTTIDPRERPSRRIPDDAIWFDERGLRLPGLNPTPHPRAGGRTDRLELLLALAFQRRLPAATLTVVVKAAADSLRGDQALANLRLALAGLSRVPAASDLPRRVALADTLLTKGMTAARLLEALDEPADGTLEKFDPDQPRVPAGGGRESGRWTNAGEAPGTPARASTLAVAASAARGAALFAPEISTAFLTGLATRAARIGAAAAVGGVLFVPWQKSVTSSGSLPGDSAHSYAYDSDEGLLQIRDASGEVVAAGHADGTGVFLDANTGIAFARQVDGALVLDGAQMTAAGSKDTATAAVGAQAGAKEDEDKPQLCPDPILDQPGALAASPRAQAYQEQISQMINPQWPLPFGFAMGLVDPATGDLVHYDECNEQTGTMIEAKGPGFTGLLSFQRGVESVTDGWLNQSLREVQAAGTRQVEWYFAEDDAATYARKLFASEDDGRENIIIKVVPAR